MALGNNRIFVLMGVAGTGKTTIGRRVSSIRKIPFFEGDDFHCKEAKQQMASGYALSDNDRLPWIKRIVAALNNQAEEECILACSALSELIRSELKKGIRSEIYFIHLTGPSQILYERLASRKGHYMKPEMLASQLATLESTADLIEVDVNDSTDTITKSIIKIMLDR